jgi:butyrate kinase
MDNAIRILAINPGSTSTKIAVYEDDQEVFKTNVEHPASELAKYPTVGSQYDMRKEEVLSCLTKAGFDIASIGAIAARGAPLPPVKGGAYRVNAEMVDLLRNRPLSEHASNVAAIIAFELGERYGIPAYIYDSISSDELPDIARLTGMAAMPRVCRCHTLNMRAMARKASEAMGETYANLNIIVTHMGGGITTSLHEKGRIIEVVSDDEGTFSPERAGSVHCAELITMCYSGKYDYQTMRKMLRGQGGLVGYLGTASAIEVEKKIAGGDKHAELIYQAMAYQIAKDIGGLSTVVNGKVDLIILTGGIAYSKMLTGWISERVGFIAPVSILPGENELESLALGILRVMRGEETAHEYHLG